MASKLLKWAEDLVEQVLEGEVGLNDAIEQFDRKLEVYDEVKKQRDRLTSARRALMGVGSRTTSSGGSRVTQDEVAKTMSEGTDAGWTVAELVGSISGATDGQIRGHLNRGKDVRFLKRESDGRWFIRDPEAGINSAEDLPDEDD
jgi:hypothetical protein